MVPDLLDILDFRSNNELYRPVIRAVQLVKDYVRSPRPLYPEEEIIPIKEVVAPKWREFVVEQDDRWHRAGQPAQLRDVRPAGPARKSAHEGDLGCREPTASAIPTTICQPTLSQNRE